MFETLLAEGGLSLDRLLNFCAVAAAGGIANAARHDPVRQSLYSRQIKELEAAFGAELTRREGKGIALTEAGQRLARLAREHLLGLEDFRRVCRGQPARFTLGASNSLLEWVVLPRLAQLRAAVPPGLRWSVQHLRTDEIVARLADFSLDIGIVREDATRAAPGGRLQTRRLFTLGYALFVPAALSAGRRFGSARELRAAFADLPLATPNGGQFREELEAAAGRAGVGLRLELTCTSFTQAARVVRGGGCAAVLPSIAAADFLHSAGVRAVPLPFLKDYARPVCLAWNPRLPAVRAEAAAVVEGVAGCLLDLSTAG